MDNLGTEFAIAAAVEKDRHWMKTTAEKYIPIAAWAEDFYKALNSQPRVLRWIAYWAMGRYARNELQGMCEALTEAGHYIHNEYSLQGADYHRETEAPQ